MKKKIFSKSTFITVLFLSLNGISNAQFLKELGKRVENSVENTISRKTEQKASEKTEEAMDGVFDAGKKRKEEKAKEAASNSSASSYESATYTFTYTATIEMDYPEKKNKDKTVMKQSYGKNSLLATISEQQMLYDFNNQDVLIIDADHKTAQAMSMKWFTKETKADDIKDANVTIEKTGRSKIINGYACFEYVLTHDDGKTIAWLAPNVPFEYKEYMKSFAKSMGKDAPKIDNDKGYVMEMSIFDKKDKETMHMLVTELQKETNTISLGNYTVTKLL